MDLAGMMLKSRIERLAKAIGIENISAGQVSEITKGLEEQVTAFRTHALEEEYPFLWIDALHDKVRIEDRVVSLALMIAHTGIQAAVQGSLHAQYPGHGSP